MSIDPRTIKQLLQLQMINTMDLFGSSRTGSTDGGAGSSFADLLKRLLANDQDQGLIQGQALRGQDQGYSQVLTGKSYGLRPSVSPLSMSPASTYDPLVEQASKQFGVGVPLIKAVIQQESSFQPFEVSSAGAKGLMQLMDATARGLGVTDSFDPEQNITGGTRFLSDLLKKYNGNEAVALAAYNAGPGRIDRLGIRTDADLRAKFGSLPQETQHYVDRVLAFKNDYTV